jgi:hypothetical protein
MELSAAIDKVKSQFEYQADRLRIFDSWRVMESKSGKYHGDCEDFALTVFWHVADGRLTRFLWHLLITHRYRMIRTQTVHGEPHVVGRIGDQWFDNWTQKALPEKEFFQNTGHRKSWTYPGPLISLYLAIGIFFR